MASSPPSMGSWEKSQHCFVLCLIVATLYIHRQSAFLIGRDRKVCGFCIACVYIFYIVLVTVLNFSIAANFYVVGKK